MNLMNLNSVAIAYLKRALFFLVISYLVMISIIYLILYIINKTLKINYLNIFKYISGGLLILYFILIILTGFGFDGWVTWLFGYA